MVFLKYYGYKNFWSQKNLNLVARPRRLLLRHELQTLPDIIVKFFCCFSYFFYKCASIVFAYFPSMQLQTSKYTDTGPTQHF